MAETMYTVSSSPHIRDNSSVQSIMRDVIIALLPATAAGIYFFGLRAFLVILTAVISCVASEWVWCKFAKTPNTIKDLSAVITGLLLAFNVPPTLPLWMVVVGSVFTMIVVKSLFGGIGQNIVNPALAGRAFLLACYPVAMTTWTNPVDGTTGATPLAMLKGVEATGEHLPSLTQAFLGQVGGCIGETSALALLIGFAYLLYRRVITWHIPVFYIGTVAVLGAIFGRGDMGAMAGLYEIMVGGVMLGGIFMATDYTTSPMTKKGQIIFAIAAGFLAMIIRKFGGYPEGCSYSILIMNLVVPLIDKYVRPRTFGTGEAK
ncbi:Na(+)-translocating ferredoxin:NAD(+) oxidoreductase complex subunit D [Clostridium haemolyticum]|uniref:RnfABCDGE type electron transport complex subunit D n=1 Tax=Clostridium haemolyticum TaxID=84025 RepID=UPI001C3B6C7A|nr:RnfABCDGE type electron transport complex subunit D [Clostridium haemolyticum]CAG7840266.1 Na(+)-translocating ferredoxin:NAD(+) oxidoreductase complex subunit D [Clostridium haemolyticum]